MYNETHLEEFIQLLKLPTYVLKLPLDDSKQVTTDCPLELVILLNQFYQTMDLSTLHASQTPCHICFPFKIHNLLLPRKEDYLLIGPLFTEALSETDFRLLLAEYGIKPTKDLLIYFHSLTHIDEETFNKLLHYLSEELGKPFTQIIPARIKKSIPRPESFFLIQESEQTGHNYACQYMDCVRCFSLQDSKALTLYAQIWEHTILLTSTPLFSYMKELVFTEFLLLSSILHEHLKEHSIPFILYQRQQWERCRTSKELVFFHHALISAFFKAIHSQTETGFSEGITAARRYIRLNFASSLRLSDIAAACHLSRAYLSSRFHKECDQTISDYILSCRMEQAKKLLQYTSLPVCEIADQCGFGDASYFTKCFVKKIGIGPEKWREGVMKRTFPGTADIL